MKQIFINLKRFDVPRKLGGVCPLDDPVAWIESVIGESVERGLGAHENLELIYLLPEGLLATASRYLAKLPGERRSMIMIGCQGVHWEDVERGKNFGAFTTSLPATAAANLGSEWAILGHSEERRAKFQVMARFEPRLQSDALSRTRAAQAVDQIVCNEVRCALQAGLQVLLCVGESAQERGEGTFEEQQPRVERVLETQLLNGLKGIEQFLRGDRIVIGYEPIWAIGPGKIPPDRGYIAFVSDFIQRVLREKIGAEISVVYGGGLKEENAAMIASIPTIGGGLVALTQFAGEIGFSVAQLDAIVAKYLL